MIYRIAIPLSLVVILAVSTTRAQTDTGPYPPPRTLPRNAGPSPWTVPGAVCSAPNPQKEKPSRPQESPQIVSPLAHLDQVNAITDIPELNYVVTASNDGTIRVWDSETADQVGLLFSDYTRRIVDVAARPDHPTEVAASISTFGSTDSYVALFDLKTGHARTLCSGGAARQLRFSPDGNTLAVLDSWTVSLWDPTTLALKKRLDGPQTAVQFLDDSTLALHNQDSVVLTDLSNGKTRAPIPTGPGTAFLGDSADGLLFHLNKNVITVWSLSTSTAVSTVRLFSEVQFLAFDQDQRKLYASGFESILGGGTRYIYRLSGPDWQSVEAFDGPDDRVTALAVARGNLMVGEYGGEVRRFNVKDKFEVETDLGIRAEDITAIATSADDRYIATGDRSGIISVWETDSGSYREIDHFHVRKSLAPYFPATGQHGASETFIFGDPAPPLFLRVLNLSFLGNSTLLAVACGSRHMLVLDILSGNTPVDATISDNGLTNFVSIGQDMLFVGSDGQIHWWNLETGKSGSFDGKVHALSSLALTPDNKTLIVAGDDGVQLFDGATFAPGRRLDRRAGRGSIALARSNTSLAVLSETQVATWDFGADSPVVTNLDRGIPKGLAPDMREEAGFQVLPSQQRIVTAGSGYGIHLWDATQPNALRRIEAGFSVTAVASDGKTILAGGRDGTIGFLDVASGTELGRLFAVSPLGWYGYTDQGFFDASPLLWDRLFFRRPGQGLATLSTSQMFDEYFTPNTIPRILLQQPIAQDPNRVASQSGAPPALIPPSVEITSPLPTVKIGHGVSQPMVATRRGAQAPPVTMNFLRPQPQGSLVETAPRLLDTQVTVTLRATDRGGGLSSCKLFRDSHLIHSFASFPKGERRVELSWVAEILPGSVEFSAYCFDKYGNRSAVARSTVVGDPKLKGTRKAFIFSVGVGQYERAGYRLQFAHADADLFADTLYASLSNTYTFDSVLRATLYDADATDTNILAGLQLLAGTYHGDHSTLPSQIRDLPAAAAQDAVFFYFSGHGGVNGQRYYLLAHNYHFDLASRRVSGALSDLDLANALEALSAAQVVFVLDACESGAELDAENGRVGPFSFKGFAQMAYDKGIFVISATQATADAHEDPELCHARFTYILVEDGLVSKFADWRPKDNVITAKEWLQFGAENLTPKTPNKQCVQPAKDSTAQAPEMRRAPTSLADQTPRLFLPDVYSGFDFTISDFRDQGSPRR